MMKKKKIDPLKLFYYLSCGALGGIIAGVIITLNLKLFPSRPFIEGLIDGALIVIVLWVIIRLLKKR